MKHVDVLKLYDFAGDSSGLLEEELNRFSKLLSGNFELKMFLCDGGQPIDARKKVVEDVFPDPSKIFSELISLVIDMGLNIQDISDEFTKIVSARQDIRFDELIFYEMPTDEILNKFKKLAGDKVKFRIKVDRGIMGGFIWKTMDGKVMDASIAQRLSNIKEEISA